MTTTPLRTVITGFGLLTPLGNNREATWEGILAGKTAIRPIETFDASGLVVHIAAEIPGFDAKTLVDKKDRKQLRTMGKAIQIGFVAGSQALQDAKLAPGSFEPTRLGISFGASTISSELEELAPGAVKTVLPGNREVNMETWGTEGMPLMPPLWLLKYLPNFAAAHVSILNNAQGPSNSITMQDVAGSQAIAEARRIIQRGAADIMLTGGADSRISILSIARMQLFYPFCTASENAAEACRPFDTQASGVVLGEGAGILVLEELGHAQKRGATIYAEVVGHGDACDFDMDGTGIAQAIQQAMKSANITVNDLDHVVSQGFSYRPYDTAEAKALELAFGKNCPPVVTFKGLIGNTGAASGGIETALSALALHHGTVPASVNYTHPDAAHPVPVLTHKKAVSKPYSLKINFADMGQCTVIVLQRWQGS